MNEDFDNVGGAPAPETDPATAPTEPAVDPSTETPAADTVTPAASSEPAAPAAEEPEVPSESVKNLQDAPTDGINLSPDARATRDILRKQKKMWITVPLDFGEKMGAVKIVNINGYQFEIKKNIPVEVPMSVGNLIVKSYRMSAEAKSGNPRNINNIRSNSPAADALNL